MNDLMAELAEVVRLADKATPGPWLYRAKSNSWYTAPPEGSRYSYGDFIMGMGDDAEGTNEWDEPFLIAAVQFLRTHHAEIAEALADARRYRWLRTLQGEVLTKKWNGESWCDASYTELDAAIDAAIDAQHNSAREGL